MFHMFVMSECTLVEKLIDGDQKGNEFDRKIHKTLNARYFVSIHFNFVFRFSFSTLRSVFFVKVKKKIECAMETLLSNAAIPIK